MNKTPISYWGGKQMLAPLICSNIPEHTTYCEPFFGGGAVFFAKPKSKVEIINDINREVVNFYVQCATNFEALQQRILATPHSRSIYHDARVIYDNPHLFSPVDRAWSFWVATNQGYSSKIGSWAFATTMDSCEKKTDNSKARFTDDLKKRLDRTQIDCVDALYLIDQRDTPETFFYIDPPYFNSHMGHYGGYTQKDFEDLLILCAGLQGKFLLSSYPSDVLTEHTHKNGWYQIELTKLTTASKARKTKVEVLTANYPIVGNLVK